MKKILFVDSWSLGLRITTPLAKELNKDFDCYYFHFDNLQAKSGKAVKKNIENFNKQDYKAFYKKIISFNEYNCSITNLIQELNPDLLIFISLHGFEQKYVNEIASYHNKPCVLFMHGLKSYDFKGVKSFFIKKIIYKFPRIIHFTKLYLYYLKDIKRNQINRSFIEKFKRFYLITIKHSKFLFNPGKDFGCNYKLIFTTTKNDENYFKNNYGLTDSTKFKIIGHIDNHNLINVLLNQNIKIQKKVLFISQPLVKEGLLSVKDFRAAIESINTISKKLNLTLTVRPHPSDDIELLNKLKTELNFEISQKKLEEDLIESEIISGFFSTLLFTAQILEKPMIIFKIENLPYLEVIFEYENSIIFENVRIDINQNLEKLKKLIKTNNTINKEKLSEIDPLNILKTEIYKILC
jgi:hypothetical protein